MPHKKAIELSQRWFEKAASDLRLAKLAFTAMPPLLDAVAFGSQQAVEKSLKGFLVFHNKKFAKIHDLRKLAQQVLEIQPSLEEVLKSAPGLTAHAVAFRYPDASTQDATPQEAAEALQIAESIFAAIKREVENG